MHEKGGGVAVGQIFWMSQYTFSSALALAAYVLSSEHACGPVARQSPWMWTYAFVPFQGLPDCFCAEYEKDDSFWSTYVWPW